jgi:hypothetical protein
MKNLFVASTLGLLALFLSGTVQAGSALDSILKQGVGSCNNSRYTCTITYNPGGDLEKFQQAAEELLAEQYWLRIDGLCASGCAILADMARANTCITPKAQIAIHQAYVYQVLNRITASGVVEEVARRLIRREDPPQSPDIDSWVRNHGGYPTRGVKVIPLKDAKQFWPMCK